MSTGLFGEALQIQDMLTYLLGHRPHIVLKQDNEAVIKIVRNKYSVKLRHCGRVHRVNIASVAEVINDESHLVRLEYCNTQVQLANPLTKILPPLHWSQALEQMCVSTFDVV